MQSVIKNSTQIEDWITEKARQRRKHSKLPPFVYPYNLGLMGNFTEVTTYVLSNVVVICTCVCVCCVGDQLLRKV